MMNRSKQSFESTELPVLPPRTHCVLIARDPNFIYAYWEYTQEDIDRLRHNPKLEGQDAELVLRVYDITSIDFNGANANHSWDLEVGVSKKNWYIQVWQDNAEYCTELGMRSGEGQFVPLMRSNMVRTPPKTISKRNDLIWQDIKLHRESQPYIKENIKERYQSLMQQHSKHHPHKEEHPQAPKPRVYHLTAHDIRTYYKKVFTDVSHRGKAHRQEKYEAPGIGDILQGRLRNVPWQKVRSFITFPDLMQRTHPGASEQKGASESLVYSQTGASDSLGHSDTAASEGRLNKRKFFFEIWAEVIVHGRTEPDATVRLNEKGVTLNPDGTFTLRYSLPDGNIPLKFIAQSSDGLEQRHIYTRVEREKTIGFPKMLGEYHG